MSRKAKGSVEWVPPDGSDPGHYKTRVRLVDGSRPWVHLPPGLAEEDAKARALSLQRTARVEQWARTPKAPAAPAARERETVSDYVRKRWIPYRRERGLLDDRNDVSRFTNHVEPVIGSIFVDALTRDDIEDVRDAIDRKIRQGYQDPRRPSLQRRMKWRTGANIWTLVTSLCDDLAHCKRRDLRRRSEVLTAGVHAPDRGEDTEKVYLYPSEFVRLVQCEAVPLHYRRLYAIAAYLYLRAGEIEALEWADVDLRRELVHVRRAVQTDGSLGPPKNGKARRVPIERTLLPLLIALRAEAASANEGKAEGRILHFAQRHDAAGNLRRYLEKAIPPDERRDELFVATTTSKPMGFHDLRATGITWRCVRGDGIEKVREHAGHKDIATTDRYMREADPIRDRFGAVFPPLPAGLFGDDDGEGLDHGMDHGAAGEGSDDDVRPTIPGRSSRCQARDSKASDGVRRGKRVQISAEIEGVDPRLGPLEPRPDRGLDHDWTTDGAPVDGLEAGLAELVRRAIGAGRLDRAEELLALARRWAEVEPEAAPAAVVSLASARARRR